MNLSNHMHFSPPATAVVAPALRYVMQRRNELRPLYSKSR
jgi:hypothetical protein